MKVLGKLSPENVLLDLAITLLAYRFIDISGFVEKTLPWLVYLIVAYQSVVLFLLYADLSVDDQPEEKDAGFGARLRGTVALVLRSFAMFSWILSFIWAILPVVYLENLTGQSFVWAKRISITVGLVSGLLLLVRFFANAEGDSEKQYIEDWFEKPADEKKTAEKIVIPIYAFLLYRIVGTSRSRYWAAYVLTFVFLVYTETLFQLIAPAPATPKIFLVPAIIFSYLPMRFLLLLRPPFSLPEVFSAIFAFALFIHSLF
ncbi:MAG: hypothetical protein JSS81_21725 [Acidobacteria bacterium]|nr:hypothetical protein [Acidobacteriota bacterium]